MKLGDNNQFFYYITDGKKAAILKYTYYLKEDVDVEILKEACEKAMDAFPFFHARPYLDEEGRVNIRESDEKAPVFPKTDSFAFLGSEDTNGYMFRVLYEKNEIHLSCFHGLSDGRGISDFGKTLLYYYFSLKGINIPEEGIYTIENIKNDDTITEILADRCKEIEAPAIEPEQPKNELFWLPEDATLYGTYHTKSVYVEWDCSKLVSLAKEMKGSPVVFLVAMLANSMAKKYNAKDKTFIYDIPVDMRGMLNSRAQSNFTSNVQLYVEPELLEKPLAEQVATLKSSLKNKIEKDNLVNSAKGASGFFDMLNSIPLKQRDALLSNIQNSAPNKTVLLSNIGKIDLPKEIQEQLEEIEFFIPVVDKVPALVPVTFGEVSRAYINQNFEDIGWIEAFCEEMNACGIETKLVDQGLVDVDTIDPNRFEQL